MGGGSAGTQFLEQEYSTGGGGWEMGGAAEMGKIVSKARGRQVEGGCQIPKTKTVSGRRMLDAIFWYTSRCTPREVEFWARFSCSKERENSQQEPERVS